MQKNRYFFSILALYPVESHTQIWMTKDKEEMKTEEILGYTLFISMEVFKFGEWTFYSKFTKKKEKKICTISTMHTRKIFSFFFLSEFKRNKKKTM